MKKLLILGLAILILGPALFADDAMVMPGKVGRFYVAPTYSFAMGGYDSDGTYEAFDDGSIKVFNLGFALEYGIVNWITAAIQWAPGWTAWSDIKAATGIKNTNINGFADIFAGAKFQIVGAKAPIKAEAVRFALAPGVKIPLPGPDFEKELQKALAGEKATLNSMDNHVFAAGGRAFFDFVINKNFFINLYNETIFYPFAQDLNKDGPMFYGIKAGMAQNPDIQAALGAGTPLIMDIKGEVDYKYVTTFELEGVFSYPISKGIDFTAGLPLTYSFSPASEYSFDYPAAIAAAGPMLTPVLNDMLAAEASHILKVTPNIGFFFKTLPLPMEAKFQYGIPVWGKSTTASHNATFQLRAYFMLP